MIAEVHLEPVACNTDNFPLRMSNQEGKQDQDAWATAKYIYHIKDSRIRAAQAKLNHC